MPLRTAPVRLCPPDDREALRNLAALIRLRPAQCQSGLVVAPESVRAARFLHREIPGIPWTEAAPSPDAGLPFADSEFDAAVALDVLTCLPPASRAARVRELVRVSRLAALISEPLGTDLQRTILESLAAQYRAASGQPQPELAGLLRHGLPTPADAFEWCDPAISCELYFAGDVDYYRRYAERMMQARLSGTAARIMNRILIHFETDTERVSLELETVPMRRHRRMYLLLTRT